MTKIHLCLLDTPPSLWSCPLIGLNKCILTPILVHLLLRYVLIGSSSVKNLGKDTLSNQKPSDKHDNARPAHARREDIRDESKGHPNNEHTASRQHDLVKTGLECNTQVIVVETLDAMKGSEKGLKEDNVTQAGYVSDNEGAKGPQGHTRSNDSDTFMKMSHDAGIHASHHNRMIIEKSQTDPVKSRNKEVTLNSRGPIRMETDDKQSAVEIVIPFCDVVFENIDLAACLRPLVSCLLLNSALSVVGSSRPFVQLLAFLVLGFLIDLGDESAVIKSIVFVDTFEIKVKL